MHEIEPVDILIIGSGPAGMSTALHLMQLDSAWADRLLVIDKATHPREKLCGGGITRPGQTILKRLGLSMRLSQVPIYEMRLVYGAEMYIFRQRKPFFRVIRRDEFDHWLVQEGRERGITVREGEAVKAIRPGKDYVEVITERAVIHAQTVVAADGSRSFVRQKLKWQDSAHMARLLEVLTPALNRDQIFFQKGVAIFDYSAILAGLQGYYWDFPSLIKGQAIMNRGVFDSRTKSKRLRGDLKGILQTAMAERDQDLADYPLKGHPLHWFDRKGCFARPRIILVGDAAGVDPMVGEGISFALGYGPVAAAALEDAFTRHDFSFATYRRRILSDPLLAELSVRTRFARFIYSLRYPWQLRLTWHLMGGIARFLAWLAPQSIPFKSLELTKVSK